MIKETLKDKAVRQLIASKGKWRVIERESGLDYNWLCKLAQGHIDDPGVNKIERLLGWFPGAETGD